MHKRNLRFLKKYRDEVEEDFIKKLRELGIEEEVIEQIKEEKPTKKKEISEDRKCSNIKEDGEKCGLFKCYKDKCWGHLTKEEKEEYKENKKTM